MKAMQDIQPEIKRIQKELKHDRQAQQAAMMALYKERGVNPAAGCLPLLLQMPIWFALFSVLRNPGKWVTEGSELAAAVSEGRVDFLWMDLSVSPSNALEIGIIDAIPYFLTILIVVFTAYWQQRQTMSRSSAQGGQQPPGQAIMKIFPLFFGFISYTLPAGLVVYFAASQIFRIGQQALILGMDGGDKKGPGQSKGGSQKETKQSRPSEDSPTTQALAGGTQRSSNVSKKKRGKKRRRK
jgi:YidC/Oxa1 family membrane protein insertase